MICAGDKGGLFHCLDACTGQRLWRQRVGPGSLLGGMEWGSAYDGQRIYVALSNFGYREYDLPINTFNDDLPICYGAYAALDKDCGTVLWLTPDPSGANLTLATCQSILATGGALFGTPGLGNLPFPLGPLTASNGVVFGTTVNGHLYALDSATGKVLWKFDTPDQSSMVTGPTLIGNSIFFLVRVMECRRQILLLQAPSSILMEFLLMEFSNEIVSFGTRYIKVLQVDVNLN